MAEMVGQFLIPDGYDTAERAPARASHRPTGNPVVDRSLRSSKTPVSAVRSTRPPSGGADNARAPRAEEEPRRRAAAGGDTDWKQF
jgi:methyl-accepting chemotaxis protein